MNNKINSLQRLHTELLINPNQKAEKIKVKTYRAGNTSSTKYKYCIYEEKIHP